LEVLNREVQAVGNGTYQMTLAIVEIDRATGEYTYMSAGSPPAMRLTAGTKTKASLLYARGTPLGTSRFVPRVSEGVLEPSQRLLMFTDGIPECKGMDGKEFGMRRFSRLAESTNEQGLDQAVSTI